jgi:hypothetical protein
MNPQSGSLPSNVSAFLDHNCRPLSADSTKLEYVSDTEPWDPPFERWLRLADHLLRDWPDTGTPCRKPDAH